MTKILLHACCGPCSLEPVRLLHEAGNDITIFFSNSNIAPADEYAHRLQVLLDWAEEEGIPVIEDDYVPEEWKTLVGREFPSRCRACYRMRLRHAARYAASNGFDALSTTLAVSPYQQGEMIAEELEAAASEAGVAWLFEDFTPFYPEATRRSRELGMYRQNYCGCAYSKAEADAERAEYRMRHKAEVAERARLREAAEAQERARKREQTAAYEAKRRAKRAARDAARAKAKGSDHS